MENLPTYKSPGADHFTGEFIKHLKNTNPSQTLPKNKRGRNISTFILQGEHYPATKTKGYHKKIKNLKGEREKLSE